MKTRRKNLKSFWMSVIGLAAPMLFLAITLVPSIALAEERPEGKKNLREKKYYYQAFNRRDPFTSLIAGEFEESQFELVDIYAVKLVGVLSGGMDKYAMLEDKNGFGYIIKAGDPIRHGSIVSVGDRTLVARLTMFGQTSSVTLRLEGNTGKGE
ncbi:MAG: hypothetical protein KAV42_08450 [Candidatus Krumholzibacteria bacterium]|nr:hypothetical protein [Candidatus Krumholzibacteria bacterium]